MEPSPFSLLPARRLLGKRWARRAVGMEAEEAGRRMAALQAHVRGFLVRRRFQHLQKEYEGVVVDIEGGLDRLRWTGQFIPRPHFNRACKGRPLNERQLVSGARGSAGGVQDWLFPSQTEKPEQDVSRDMEPLCQNGTRELPGTDGGEIILNPCGNADYPDRQGPCPTTGELGDRLNGSSVWIGSFTETGPSTVHRELPFSEGSKDLSRNVADLRQHRNHLAMEMLWLQQAIASRKNYLILKRRLGAPDPEDILGQEIAEHL